LSIALGLAASAASGSVLQSDVVDRVQLLRDVQILSADDMEGRQVGTSGGAKARAFVVERFRQSGLEPVGDSFEHPFTFSRAARGGAAPVEIRGVNVVGKISGTRQPERYIVISAHYDHVGVRNGVVFNGADDNASGTAALFALAKHFSSHRPVNSLVFVAFDAEETGLRGARSFIERPPVEKSAIVLNLNMDMIGRDPDNTLYVVGTHARPFLKPIVTRVAADAAVKLVMGHDDPAQAPAVQNWTTMSDHYAFMEAGIPALYFGVEDFEHIHRATDDYETMTHDFYERAVRTMIAVVREFDGSLDEVVRGRGGAPQP
jgi:Zn-dependent M28 family amino/carboxypeptidase